MVTTRLQCREFPLTAWISVGAERRERRIEALTSGETLFVLHLMSFKWDREMPYPTYATLAKRMGITDKMARRYAQSLDKKGYLRRHYQRKAANRFDLTGLFEALSRPLRTM